MKIKIIKHTTYLPQILDHPFRILIIGGSRFRKINSLLNYINPQPDIHEIIVTRKEIVWK